MHRIPLSYFPVAALLGVLALLNIVFLRHHALSTAIAVLLYVIVLVLAFFGGRSARRHQSRPALFGAMIGALFGIIAGLGSFLIRDTLRDIDVPAQTGVRMHLLLWANSPAGHITAAVTTMVAFGVISLMVGILGGFTVKDPERSDWA